MIKRILPLGLAIVCMCAGAPAGAAVDTVTHYQQNIHATDLASMVAWGGARAGYWCQVDSNGSAQHVLYGAFPSGSYLGNSPDVVSGQNGVQWVSLQIIVRNLAGVAVSLVTNTTPGTMPAVGAANTIAVSTGTGATWLSFSDTLHGQRGGGDTHPPASTTINGFMPAFGTTANRVPLTTGTGITMSQVPDQAISGLSYSKLTGVPSITATAPITGGGSLTGLGVSIGISAATQSAAGSMSGPDKAKLDGIAANADATPDATTTVKGKVQLAGDIAGTASSVVVQRVNGATVPSAGALTSNHVLYVNGTSSLTYGYLTDQQIASNANIAPGKMAPGLNNQLMVTTGTASGWAYFSDLLHGQRGGGDTHPPASTTINGFMPAFGTTANRVPLTTGTGITMSQVPDQAISGLSYSKLTGVPNVTVHYPLILNGVILDQNTGSLTTSPDLSIANVTTTTAGSMVPADKAKLDGLPSSAVPSARKLFATAPIRIDNNSSADMSSDRTISILAATQLAYGSMSPVDKLKADAIPLPSSTDAGKLLYASGANTYNLSTTSILNLLTGSGTPGAIPKFTSSNTFGDSVMRDSGTGVVTVSAVLQAKNFLMIGTDASAQWVKIGTYTASQSGRTLTLMAYVHEGYNASNAQDSIIYLTFKTSNGGNANGYGFAANSNFYVIGENRWFVPGSIVWKANVAGVNATAFDLYMRLPPWSGGSHYAVTVDEASTWTNAPAGNQVDPGPENATVLKPTRSFQVQGDYGNAIQFAAGVVNPPAIISQAPNTDTDGYGNPFVIAAQSATGTGNTQGGTMRLSTGSGTTPGAFYVDLGGTEALSIYRHPPYNGNALHVNGSIFFPRTLAPYQEVDTLFGWDNANYNERQNTQGGSLTIQAETVVASNSYGGSVYVKAGDGYDSTRVGTVNLMAGSSTLQVRPDAVSVNTNPLVVASATGTIATSAAGFTGKEITKYAELTSNIAGGGPVYVDFTPPSGTAVNGKDYHAVITVMVKGAFHHTFGATATWTKETNGVFHGVEYASFGNAANIAVGQDVANANTMRFIVGAPAGTCYWKFRIQVVEN